MTIKLPLEPKVAESHALHGKFAISDLNGLVLVGFYPAAPAETKHAAEVVLDGANRFAIKSYPDKNAPFDRGFDHCLELPVSRIDIELLAPGRFGESASLQPGDLFFCEQGTFLAGQPEQSYANNFIDLATKAMAKVDTRLGFIASGWKITGYDADGRVTLTIDRS